MLKIFFGLSSSHCISFVIKRHPKSKFFLLAKNFSIDTVQTSKTSRSLFLRKKSNMSVFRFSDYDCIGFDLDNTLLRYNITNVVPLEYDLITNFLVNQKGYSPKYLKAPVTSKDLDFIQKGLFIDVVKGNLLKVSPTGRVYRGCHGTRVLSAEEIEDFYPNQIWETGKIFCQEPLMAWNGPLSLKIRTLVDYFDSPAGLAFAKAIDTIDEENGYLLKEYNVWNDILEAFSDMYCREQLPNNRGYYFSEVQANPGKYIQKCDPSLLEWLKKIKDSKKIFLLTGSNSDFVNITAGHAFGDNWRSLFHIVVCYAKKPGFFRENRPFYSVKHCYEDKEVKGEDLVEGQIYNQGNWKEFQIFLSKICNVKNPKCLYIGDNLLQDIYAPKYFVNCDTIAVVDEHLAEGILHHDLSHSDEEIIKSEHWGSFFCLKDSKKNYSESFWNYIIRKYSKICIPKLEIVSKIPLDTPLECFNTENDNDSLSGYHPNKPVSILNL